VSWESEAKYQKTSDRVLCKYDVEQACDISASRERKQSWHIMTATSEQQHLSLMSSLKVREHTLLQTCHM